MSSDELLAWVYRGVIICGLVAASSVHAQDAIPIVQPDDLKRSDLSADQTRGNGQQIAANQRQQLAFDKRGTPESPMIVEMVNPPNGDAIASQLERGRKDQATTDRWNWIFSGLLVLVGVGQGAVLLYTALVSNKAANAADLNARALIQSQRAFVVSKGFRNVVQGDVITCFHIWENSGSTPTRNMVSRINCAKLDSVLPAEFPFDDVSATEDTLIIVGPKSSQEMMVGERFMARDLEDIFHERKFFYVWGWATYNDILTDAPHITKYCYRMTVGALTYNNETGAIQAAGFGWELYPKNNCADDECYTSRPRNRSQLISAQGAGSSQKA